VFLFSGLTMVALALLAFTTRSYRLLSAEYQQGRAPDAGGGEDEAPDGAGAEGEAGSDPDGEAGSDAGGESGVDATQRRR
jgi:DHA3 family multidrug efflux protein-like MFS transporter